MTLDANTPSFSPARTAPIRSTERSRRRLPIVAKAAAVAIAIAVAPTAAYAVSISSGQGFGDQTVYDIDNHGWWGKGTLTSTHGNPVYYSGLVIYDNAHDLYCGRYTPNTRSTTKVNSGGECDGPDDTVGTSDGGKAQVCRDINNFPDSCGPYVTIRTW